MAIGSWVPLRGVGPNAPSVKCRCFRARALLRRCAPQSLFLCGFQAFAPARVEAILFLNYWRNFVVFEAS